MYDKITRNIRVSVEPSYLNDQSSPEDNYYAWAYRVRIENQGADIVQLRTRHWRITDKMGRIQEVRGVGVVGEQPVLNPGEHAFFKSRLASPPPEGRNIDVRFFNKRDLAGGRA